jgi:lysophospholipase L1-like esterase
VNAVAVAALVSITGWGNDVARPVPATVARVPAPVVATSGVHFFGAHTVILADGYTGTESPWANDRPAFFASFTASGPFSVFFKGTGAVLRVRIDGGVARTVRTRSDGGHYVLRVALRGRHAAGLEVGPGGELAGVTGRVRPLTLHTTARAVFLGDSYTLGVGSGTPISFAQRAGWRLGWDVWADGVGGTGYVNDGGKQYFGERLERDLALRPAVVVVAGGINDYSRQPEDVILDEARSLFERIMATGARLVVLSPWVTPARRSDGYLRFADRLRGVAESAGAQWIDTQRWLVGGGLVGADGVHPTGRGYARVADELARALGR